MRRPIARLAAACALAVATMALTGSAIAGGGNSANAPGQQKQDQAAAQPQAPAQAQSTAPGQAKKSTSSPQAGVKPSSTTAHTGSHPSHTTVGANPDVSKRYGNGKTAAQIAKGRGAPDSQPLTGPGNSQPHKTYDCKHKNNKSGGVDVHAIKSYDASSCQTSQTQSESQTTTHVCGETTITSTSTQVAGVLHGKHQHLMTNTHSAHFTKHADQKVVVTTSQTQVVPTGENCSTPQVTPQVTPQATPQAAPTQASAPQTAAGALPATQGMPSTGGVLGAQTTLAKPKAHHGVLGTVANVAGSNLPFTGFPLWVAMVIAAALILAGLAVRRRGLRA